MIKQQTETELKTFSLLQLGKERSIVEIDGKIKIGKNYNLSVIASLRGYEKLTELFMNKAILSNARKLEEKEFQ